MELFATPLVPDARGSVELARVVSPFSVAVTADGTHRHRLALDLEGLPGAQELGAAEYVAWIASATLGAVRRAGTVDNGPNDLGIVERNKFAVWVSAEPAVGSQQRRGPLVLRGTSPSSRMHPEDLITQSPLALLGALPADASAHGHDDAATSWPMPPMHPAIPAMPGMMALRPGGDSFVAAGDPGTLPAALPPSVVTLPDGGTLDLEAGLVARQLGNRTHVMWAFNGQIPGPMIRVPEGARIVVNFTNNTELPTAVHWHGIRLENRYDGVPGLTQDAVQPGASFRYEVVFPDAGVYWYHPHHREDIAQDLGLAGNLVVDPARRDAYGPAHREIVLMLDDLTVGDTGIVPYGKDAANYALMGRHGNVLLANGETDYALEVTTGEVVRFFLTNAANARTFNVSIRDASDGIVPLKLVAADVSRFEREAFVDSVVLGPAERYVVEARIPEPGRYHLVNEVQSINHRSAAFFAERATLGTITATAAVAIPDLSASAAAVRVNADVSAEIRQYARLFDRPPDHELVLRLEAGRLPLVIDQLMSKDRVYFNPVEWSDTMAMMNYVTTTEEIRWQLVDPATGRRDEAIDDWRFRVGDIVKVRLHNDRTSFHAMQHPVHFHGQRFLVLDQDGIRNENLAWKDTVVVPVGATVDVLLELTNPGKWMLHCHIAEHLESGMKMVFHVDP